MSGGDVNAAAETIRRVISYAESEFGTFPHALAALDALVAEVERLTERNGDLEEILTGLRLHQASVTPYGQLQAERDAAMAEVESLRAGHVAIHKQCSDAVAERNESQKVAEQLRAERDAARAALPGDAELARSLAREQRLQEALRDLDALTFENDDDEKCVRAIIAEALAADPPPQEEA